MKTRVAAAIAALVLGMAAPASSALAFDTHAPRGYYTGFNTGFLPYEPPVTGALGLSGSRFPGSCPMSSAAEGNANQQNFPVKQYGQTAGGNRC